MIVTNITKWDKNRNDIYFIVIVIQSCDLVIKLLEELIYSFRVGAIVYLNSYILFFILSIFFNNIML